MIKVYNHRTTYSGSSSGSSRVGGAPGWPGRAAADHASRDASAATAVAAAVCCSMIIYIFVYVYINIYTYILYNCQERYLSLSKIRHFLRKWITCFENMIFRLKVWVFLRQTIIFFEIMICSLKNMTYSKNINYLFQKYELCDQKTYLYGESNKYGK